MSTYSIIETSKWINRKTKELTKEIVNAVTIYRDSSREVSFSAPPPEDEFINYTIEIERLAAISHVPSGIQWKDAGYYTKIPPVAPRPEGINMNVFRRHFAYDNIRSLEEWKEILTSPYHVANRGDGRSISLSEYLNNLCERPMSNGKNFGRYLLEKRIVPSGFRRDPGSDSYMQLIETNELKTMLVKYRLMSSQ